MELPKVGATSSRERLGIAAVQTYAARRNQIWREIDVSDVGIDGNLEFVDANGHATGRMVALQIKSGPSYFANPSKYGWKFYPKTSHRNYWEAFPLPVLLVLHNPDSNVSYWTEARQALRSPDAAGKAFIEVPQQNVLENTSVIELFETAGAQDQAFIHDLATVLAQLITTRSKEASFPLSHFDLFTHGLTNICRSIYYGTDLVTDAVEFNLLAANAPFGMGMGPNEQQFAFGFVRFLLAQGLALIDYSDCLIDWVDREMQPHFVAPLTSRGRALVSLIQQEESRLVSAGQLPEESYRHVAQEGFFGMVLESYFPRFPRIRSFQEKFHY